jgi:hypothetical protein
MINLATYDESVVAECSGGAPPSVDHRAGSGGHFGLPLSSRRCHLYLELSMLSLGLS